MTFSGNMPGIDILASDTNHTRTVTIQVKTKSRGTWQTDSKRAMPANRQVTPEGLRFWVMVSLPAPPTSPAFFIMPEKWILDDIHKRAEAGRKRYRELHGTERGSFHHAIALNRVAQWQDRWDLLDILSG